MGRRILSGILFSGSTTELMSLSELSILHCHESIYSGDAQMIVDELRHWIARNHERTDNHGIALGLLSSVQSALAASEPEGIARVKPPMRRFALW